jgi:hypothetical protein
MLKPLLRRAWVKLLTWNMAWLSRMVYPGCWPGLPCTVFVNFNSSAAPLSAYTVRHDASGNLSLTLTWNAPANMPIAVIGEDSAWPPDTVGVATRLIGNWSGSIEPKTEHGAPQDYPGGASTKLLCAWCTPTQVGVIVMASSQEHNTLA